MKTEILDEHYTVRGLGAVNYCFSKLAAFMRVAHLSLLWEQQARDITVDICADFPVLQ